MDLGGGWDYTTSLHTRENLTTSLRLKEMMFQAHARQLPLRGEL